MVKGKGKIMVKFNKKRNIRGLGLNHNADVHTFIFHLKDAKDTLLHALKLMNINLNSL